jgi:hypothetical protein
MSLDDDIAAWAAAASLPAAEADAIFRRIVATPPVPAAHVLAAHALARTAPGLAPSWWRKHTAGFAAQMVASTAPVRRAA